MIVTDGKGHHVTGLKASDFHIFEDDVEQQVASFATATAASASLEVTPATPRPGLPSASEAATPASTVHTFVICVDALHSAFADSVRTREALARLFEKEKAGGAQYVLLSIGRQLRVLQAATGDPAAVLPSFATLSSSPLSVEAMPRPCGLN